MGKPLGVGSLGQIPFGTIVGGQNLGERNVGRAWGPGGDRAAMPSIDPLSRSPYYPSDAEKNFDDVPILEMVQMDGANVVAGANGGFDALVEKVTTIERTFRHPVIIRGEVDFEANVGGADPQCVKNFLFAWPNRRVARRIAGTSSGNGFGAEQIVVRSTDAGTMYLPRGKWFIGYGDTNPITISIIDARDPIFAQWLLYSWRGMHALTRHERDFRLIGNTLQVVLQANRWRRCAYIQNTSLPDPTLAIDRRVRIFTTTTPLPFDPVGPLEARGIQLSPGDIFPIVGETLFQSQVQAIPENKAAVSGDRITVHASEFI